MTLKKALGLLITAAIFFSVSGGRAEEPTTSATDEPVPTVIDRWTDPEAYPDFSFPEDARLLEIWFPQLHDADAAVLMYDGEVWMIDCSDDKKMGGRLEILLKALDLKHIGKVINTHPHHDHLNGLKNVLAYADVGELAVCFPPDSTETMIKAMTLAEQEGIPVTEYGDEDDFFMGDGKVRLHVWMKTEEDAEMNDRSAQIMLTYGDRSMLFMADMERHGQAVLLDTVGADALKADIIKYPHHGKSAMYEPFYLAVDPQMAVVTNAISVIAVKEGENFLKYHRIPSIVYTVRPMIHLVTDGTTWLCERSLSELTVK